MKFSLLKISSMIRRSHDPDCALIIGLHEPCAVTSALCERAQQAGLITYQVIHDAQAKGISISEKKSSFPQHYQVRLDISSSDAVIEFFNKIAGRCVTPKWVVHYLERPLPIETLSMTAQDLESTWRLHGLSAFIFGQATVKAMLKNGVKNDAAYSPTMIFLGAMDAVQSQPDFSGFSAVKAGVRALAQSMAREFDPQGIHVAHVLLDNHDAANQKFADAAAMTCWQIYTQPMQAWTQELELRSA